MKKTLLTIAFAVAAFVGVNAQTYYFSQSSQTYTPVSGGTSLNQATVWDDDEFPTTIGFPFTFAGTTYNDVTVNGNGSLWFNDGTGDRIILGMDADLLDRGDGTGTTQSPIVSAITGSAGSRIRMFEWQNTGFYDGAPTDVVNFQIWLHEGTNAISIHYGSNTIADVQTAFSGETGPGVGVITALNTSSGNYSGLVLTGPAATPTPTTVNMGTTIYYLTGVPANGTVYNFTLSPTATPNEVLAAQLQVFPNPATDMLYIHLTEPASAAVSVRVLDLMGRQVLAPQPAETQLQQISISSLAAGTYLLEVQQNGARALRKFLKN